MRTILPILLAFSLAGCIPNYRTVDEACDDKLPGDGGITNQTSKDVFLRINCYRRVDKLSRARMDNLVQEAVENHEGYLQANFVPEDWGTDLGAETSGEEGFTGADPYDRLEDVGYQGVDTGKMGLWQYLYWDDEEATSRIDFWFHDPQARQSFLQLAWIAGGYDEGPLANIEEGMGSPNMAYMNIFYQIPVTDHAGVPAIYPRDGQEEIPTGFEGVDPDNPMTGQGVIGYPITVAVGSIEGSGGSDNPHNINVFSSKLEGPNGTVELETFTPAQDPWMRYTAAFYPLEELQPNSEYTFTFEMSWAELDKREFTSTFKTGKQSIPHGYEAITGREVPRRPTIRHAILDL